MFLTCIWGWSLLSGTRCSGTLSAGVSAVIWHKFVFLEPTRIPWICSQSPSYPNLIVTVTFYMSVTSAQTNNSSMHKVCFSIRKGKVHLTFPFSSPVFVVLQFWLQEWQLSWERSSFGPCRAWRLCPYFYRSALFRCVLALCLNCINKWRFPAPGAPWLCCSGNLCMALRSSRAAWSEYQETLSSAPPEHHICGLKTCLFLSGKEQPPLLKIKAVTWQLIWCRPWENNTSIAAWWSRGSLSLFSFAGWCCLQPPVIGQILIKTLRNSYFFCFFEM